MENNIRALLGRLTDGQKLAILVLLLGERASLAPSPQSQPERRLDDPD
jgi:hypothetical protein